MAYDLEEQEQLESLKAWWKQYGNAVTWALIVILLGLAAWSGWNYWQRVQARDAPLLYEQVTKAAESRDAEREARRYRPRREVRSYRLWPDERAGRGQGAVRSR
jgi:predicted negative regulator of RcsB-dependent stress response